MDKIAIDLKIKKHIIFFFGCGPVMNKNIISIIFLLFLTSFITLNSSANASDLRRIADGEEVLGDIHNLQKNGKWVQAYNMAYDYYETTEHPGVLREMILSCEKMSNIHKCHDRLMVWAMFSGQDGDGVGLVLFGEMIALDEDFDSLKVSFGYGIIARHLFQHFDMNIKDEDEWVMRGEDLINKSYEQIKDHDRFDEDGVSEVINKYLDDISKRAREWYLRKIGGEVLVLSVDESEQQTTAEDDSGYDGDELAD